MINSIRDAVANYATRVTESWVQLVTAGMGIWWVSNVAAGILIGNWNWGYPAKPESAVMLAGVIPVTVNGWHYLFHFVSGIAAIAMAQRKSRALAYSFGVAGIYFAFAGIGFATGDSVVLGLFAVATLDNAVHLIEGIALLLGATATVWADAKPQVRRRHPGDHRLTSGLESG